MSFILMMAARIDACCCHVTVANSCV